MAEGQYYWCLEHHRVEPYDGCKAADRLGPYDTVDEAERAIQRVEERNEEWDNDPRFNDEVVEDDDDLVVEIDDDGWGPFRA